jgi:hypothetical protein
MAYNSYLAANNGNGLRSTTYFDPIYNDFDFEPITNRNYQTSYIPSTLNSSYLNSDILLNSGLPDTSAPLLTQAFNSSRNNFTNNYVPTQINNQQNPKSRNANKQLVNNKGDFNININVDNQNENQYPNSILQQQHQYMLQKKALQNQYFNNQKQLKGGLGYQPEQNFSNNNNNNFDFNDFDTFDNKQFSNRNNDNNLQNNNDIHRRHQNGGNAGEDNSIASTDAEPIASASPVPRRSNNGNNKNNVYEKLYQEAFENTGK